MPTAAKNAADKAATIRTFPPSEELPGWQELFPTTRNQVARHEKVFPSAESARWFIRDPDNKSALIEAEALAFHRAKWWIHPDRARKVIERKAIDAARRRAA
jgi:hypothetical protein